MSSLFANNFLRFTASFSIPQCQRVHFGFPLITGAAFISTGLKTANDTPFSHAPLLFFPNELPPESLDKVGGGGKKNKQTTYKSLKPFKILPELKKSPRDLSFMCVVSE